MFDPLHERRGEPGSELRTIHEVEMRQRCHRIERLDHGHRNRRITKAADEAEERRGERLAPEPAPGQLACVAHRSAVILQSAERTEVRIANRLAER